MKTKPSEHVGDRSERLNELGPNLTSASQLLYSRDQCCRDCMAGHNITGYGIVSRSFILLLGNNFPISKIRGLG